MRSYFVALIACLAVSHVLSLPARAAERPNFVFIYTDDQRWDALGVVQREQGEKARFPWLRTPALDRMAKEGVRFRNAFVVNSLCSPSRASFLTGCYGHLNGIVNNHTPFPEDNVTYASLLRSAGYATGFVGKWHMGKQSGQRPGFDYSASFLGQGRYFDCPFEINGETTQTKGWVDDVSTDYAVEFLRRNRTKPFLLVMGYKTAHGPFDPPPRHANTYQGEQARSVPNMNDPAIYRSEKRGGGKTELPDLVPTNMGYFRGLTAIDENVGRVLHVLDELQLSDRTMVVFSSDNGFYLGEHGLGDKRSAYDESLRIPLIIRYPKLGGSKVVDRMALNIDIAPTLLEYAGVDVPERMQGRSWRPLLEGNAAGWRDAFFYCYFYERGFTTPTVTAVRTDTAKLIKYPGHEEWTEMFDLAADPYETSNLIDSPERAALRQELETQYQRQAAAIDFEIPPFADDPKKDQPPPALNTWVLEYRFSKDEGDRVVDTSGKNNHGKATGAPLAEGRDGRPARRFDGKGFIEVPRAPSLDPSVGAWTVEAVFKSDAPDGVVLARGGQTAGYCVYLQDGRPHLTVTAANRPIDIGGRQSVAGAWTTLVARITADRQIVLLVNDKQVAARKLPRFIPNDPNDSMQIGADLKSPVIEENMPRFQGLIESVRLYSGEAP